MEQSYLDKTIEKELIERLNTDPAAFEKLYNHYLPQIYAYVYKRTSHRETTEDIVSGVFLKAFNKIDSYKPQGYTFGAWLYRIATNSLIDHYKKKSKHEQTALEYDIAVDEEQDKKVDIDFKNKQINNTMDKLTGRYKEIIYLKYFAQMDTDEIAEVMAIKPNNVRVLLSRALKKFKKEWAYDI